MTIQAPSLEAAARSRLLHTWKVAYYQGTPLVEDAVYDYHEKRQLEEWPEDPELKVVGGVIESSFEQVKDGEPMLSLRKTYDMEELARFINNKSIVVELKIDGMSLELRYCNGYLVQAVSRGRGGELGFDVTQNALFIKGIAHFIEGFTGRIRGEVVMTYEDFERFKKGEIEKGNKAPSHPRNVATGTMQQKDPRIVGERNLRFISYIVERETDYFSNETDALRWLKEKGFTLPRCKSYKTGVAFTQQIETQLQVWQSEMKSAPYPCDGIVVLYNDRYFRKSLGNSTNYPHGARAFKWEDETAESRIIDIEWSTGRLGDVNPVGIIEETELSGAKIQRVTLHHVGYVRAHNIKIGSVIKIIRSGEIIPKHLETISTSHYEEFNIPTKCPTCGTDLIEEIGVTEGASSLICTNYDCPAQKFEKILHFVKTTNIEHLGSGILEALFKQGVVKNIPDLYLIPGKGIEYVIINGKTLGARRAKKINVSIEKASVLTLPVFLASLGVRGLGLGTAKKVCEKFNTLDAVLAAGVNDFLGVENFAHTRASLVYHGLQKHLSLIQQLLSLIKFRTEEELVLPGVLSGLRFVVTGSFSDDNPRKEIENMIKAAGGILQTSPNRYTSYLVQGEGGGSKVSKAAQFKVPVLNEVEFLSLLCERSQKLEDINEED